jgi:hypothetical protein
VNKPVLVDPASVKKLTVSTFSAGEVVKNQAVLLV